MPGILQRAGNGKGRGSGQGGVRGGGEREKGDNTREIGMEQGGGEGGNN